MGYRLGQIIKILKAEGAKHDEEFVSMYIRHCNSPNTAIAQLVKILCSWYYFQLQHEKWYPTINTFEEMHLKPNLLRGLYQNDIKKPTDVQKKALLPLITKGSDKDIKVESFKGSGKTMALSIAALQRIDSQISQCQILILTDNDQMAEENERYIRKLGCFMKVSCKAIINGDCNDAKYLQKGTQIVIGRPVKIYQMIMQNSLSVKHLKLFVLDDADSMIYRNGHGDYVRDCIYCLPMLQMALFSTRPFKKYICMPWRISIKVRKEIVMKERELQ